MLTKLRAGMFAAVVVATGGWLWLGHAGTPAAAQTTPIAAPVGLVAPGRVEPVRDPVALAFEVSGRIVAIGVDEGDRVHAGDVIARLDDRLPAARAASAKADLAAAQARYALARRGPRAEDIAAARLEADAAATDADHRGVEQSRSEKLGETGALASSAVDADVAAARVARATADAATARYRALAAGTRAEQIDEAAAAVAAARAELDAANVALDQTVLRAPADGVVLRRTAEVGALVTLTPPVTVVTVADVAKLEVRAEIDEAEVARVAVGEPAYATADAYGDRRFPVHVTRITGELGRKTVRDDDPRAKVDTRVLEVVARFDNAEQLPLGLRMTVHGS
jgi:HlyD family secretion protein